MSNQTLSWPDRPVAWPCDSRNDHLDELFFVRFLHLLFGADAEHVAVANINEGLIAHQVDTHDAFLIFASSSLGEIS